MKFCHNIYAKCAATRIWHRRATGWVKLAVSLVWLTASVALSQAPSAYLQDLLAKAKSRQVATSLQWRRLLLIPDRTLPSDVSMVDGANFFLAQDGRDRPDSELDATLAGFFQPQESGDLANHHPRCRHPARWKFLSSVLDIDSHKLPPVTCHDLEAFLSRLKYDRVSLVFSNYFMENPASLFGHTFLKMHRVRGPGEEDVPLLDDAANFAAAVDDNYSLLYPFKGLFGGYWGAFSLFPYHRKIQEYNNHESRDLWEYDLRLTPVEVEFLVLVLWELGFTRISYYYLHQNCSYVMLALLEAAAPRLELTRKFQLYAIPSDTLRAVATVPDMVQGVHYRPSAESRYLLRLGQLQEHEFKLLEEIVATQDDVRSQPWQGCEKDCQARVLDAALEYFDFAEKLAGSQTAVKYASIRQAVLLQRASLGIKAPVLGAQAVSSRVDLGHDSAFVGVRGGDNTSHGGYLDLNWRPALQDLVSNAVGYQEQMEVKVLDLTVRKWVSRPGLALRHLDLLRIASYASDLPLASHVSWGFGLGGEQGYGYGPAQDVMRSYLYLQAGKSMATNSRNLVAFAMGGWDLGYASQKHTPWHTGPRITAGLVYRPHPDIRLVLNANYGRYFDPRPIVRFESEVQLMGTLRRNLDLGLFALSRSGQQEVSLGVRQWF